MPSLNIWESSGPGGSKESIGGRRPRKKDTSAQESDGLSENSR